MSAIQAPIDSATPFTLRLHQEPLPPPTPGRDLRFIWQNEFAPTLKRKASSTIAEYLGTLNAWERLTDNPAPELLNAEVLSDFQDALINEPKTNSSARSYATVNKRLRTLAPLIRWCWPKDSHNTSGKGYCEYFTLPDRLPEDEKIPVTFTHKQLSMLYYYASELDWPKVEPALVWRTIFVLGFNCGPRTFDNFALNWDDIDFSYRNYMGAITFQAQKTRKRQRIPMNPVVHRHLTLLHRVTGHTGRVFPECFAPTNKHVIGKKWQVFRDLVGLTEDHKLESLRKTCNTTYRNMGFGDEGEWILGHSLKGVNARNYYDPTRSVLKAIRNMPQPKAFALMDKYAPAKKSIA